MTIYWLPTPNIWVGWGFALLSTFCFSIAPPVVKVGYSLGLHPTVLLAARLLITFALLAASIGLSTPDRLRIDRRGLLIVVIAGLANGVGMLTFFWSLTRIDASVASMMLSLNPLVVLGLLALRGEKLTRRHIARLSLGLGGVYLLIGPGGHLDAIGLLLLVVAIVAISSQLVIYQWFLQGYSARTVTLYVVGVMAAVTTVFWLIQGVAWTQPTWEGWVVIGVLAVVSTYLARLALFASVRSLGSGQIALLMPLETLMTVTWSLLFLQERLTLWQWAGGALILSSAVLAVKRLRWARWRVWWRL